MNTRVVRLVGNGDTTGGGLPLPVAFGAVVQELLDNGPASFRDLVAVVTASMSLKEARILGRESAWCTWDDFTRDILSQLSGVDGDAVRVITRVITCLGDTYCLAPGFMSGVHLVIRSPKVYFTVWDKETRLEEEKRTRSLMNARRILADAEQEAARDSDEVWRKVVKLIAARVRELGDSGETRVMALANSLPSKRREKREGPPQRGRKEWQQATGWNVSDPFGLLIREFYATEEDNFLPVTAQDVRAYIMKRLAAVEAGTPWAGQDVSPGAITGKAGTHQGLTGLEREGFLSRDASRRPIFWTRVREV